MTGTGLARRQAAVLGTLTLGSFVVVLDSAVVFVPLPAILGELGGTLDQGAWVLGGFVLTFAAFLLPCLRLTDRRDPAMLFGGGVTLFTLASSAAALSSSMWFLLGARVVQGLAAALTEAAVFASLKALFAAQQRERVFRVQGAAVGLGALLGPIVGGAVTTGLSWRFVFWLDVLLGVVVLVGALLSLPRSRRVPGEGNPVGLGWWLGGVGLFLLLFGIVEGAPLGWSSPLIVGAFGAAAVSLAAASGYERRSHVASARWRLWRFRRFAVGNVLRAVNEFASLGVFFALSHFLQTELGYSALVAGALLLAVIFGALATSPVAERLSARLDARLVVVPGFVLLAGGIFWVARVTPETGWEFFVAPLAVAGAGFGLMESVVVETTRTALPDTRSTDGWGISYTSYLLGIGLGVATVAAVWQSETAAGVREGLARSGLGQVGDDVVASYLARGGDRTGEVGAVLSRAVADAVNTALLACVVVAALAAVIALWFSPARTGSERPRGRLPF